MALVRIIISWWPLLFLLSSSAFSNDEDRVCRSLDGQSCLSEDPTLCLDAHPNCAEWAAQGHCSGSSQVYMVSTCRYSCQTCRESQDLLEDFGVAQSVEDVVHQKAIRQLIVQTRAYLMTLQNSSSCQLKHENCVFWAATGQCQATPEYMNDNCAPVCQTCSDDERLNESIDLLEEFGVPQTIDKNTADQVRNTIRRTREYMTSLLGPNIANLCQNKHESCAFWATLGECQNTAAYMNQNCNPVCQTCHLLETDSPPL